MKIEDRENRFQVIWDLGRRCTYACTYCPPHRNNKTSPIVGLEDLKSSMDFLDDYISIYEDMREKPYNIKSLSFTGGEPTIHPGFLQFGRYIKEKYGETYSVNMTTNGVFSKKKANQYKELFGGTISYHPEGNPKEKALAIENIFTMGRKYKVNVMFHKDYFEECMKLCEDLKEAGIKHIPRRIGDDGDDEWSIKRGYTHVYTQEQEEWFSDWFKPNRHKDKKKKKEWLSKPKGRMCCGGRDFCLNGKEGATFVDNTNFYGYHCLVNWYFLYINQETRDIYHHQTCMVNLDNDIAPIGTLDDSHKIIERLENHYMVDRKMPMITCPKTFCGCGMCVDKVHPEWEKTDFGIKKVELVHNLIKPYEHTQEITVRKRMEELDEKH